MSLTAPAEGLAVWNKTGDNLSGNTQPSLNWSQPASGDDIVFELATDEDFRLRQMRVDTRVDNDFSASDGTLAMTGSNTLEVGNMYFWRMATVDSDDHYGEWVSSSFLVSSLESIWLGGDRYQFNLKHGNGSQDNQYPECMDTYIDSAAPNDNYDGDSEMTIDYSPFGGEITGLVGCNLVSNLLPDGYAVESAHLSMSLTSTTFGTPTIGVWESNQNDWSAEDATWTSYDGSNSWATAGAKGAERGSLLDSVSVGNSFSEGDSVEWNVTWPFRTPCAKIAVLTSSRACSVPVPVAPGQRTSARPRIRWQAVPSFPLSTCPARMRCLLTPHRRCHSTVRGPLVQCGLDPHHPTGTRLELCRLHGTRWLHRPVGHANRLLFGERWTYTSWNDAGFDLTNTSFTLQSDLDEGKTWYWRVRAVSATNQIGNWSNAYHFQLPT